MDDCRDIWTVVLAYIDCGSDYKTVCLVDKLRSGIIKIVRPDADTKFANHLLTLVGMVVRGGYLPKGFDSREQFIKKFAKTAISNGNVPIEFINAHRDWPWDLRDIVWNPNMSTTWLDTIADDCWQHASVRACITMDYILANPDRPWCWARVAQNPNVTMEIIDSYPKLRQELRSICLNPNVTEKYFLDRLEEFKTENYFVSRYVPVTVQTVRTHPDFPWSWGELTLNDHMSIADINANSDLPWVDNFIGIKSNVTTDDIEANPNINWDWSYLIGTGTITFEFVKKNQHLWTMRDVLNNPNVTWADAEANPDGICGEPWDKKLMGDCRDLTWKKIVELDRDGLEWEWSHIFNNQFG